MTVHLRFFASLRERLGRRELDFELPEGASVADLWQALCAAHGELVPLGSSMTFAVNREYVDRAHRLAAGDEVAIIPPVSGG